MTELKNFKAVCHKYLVIRDDTYIDIIFGTVFANRLDSKPVWLYLVGPPSCGKTEILQALTGSEIEAVSRITSKTLTSAWEDPKRKKDSSLLPKLHGKTMIIKDFTAMIHTKSDSLMEIIGQLRDAYDGSARSVYGTGKDTQYHSKFGIIAAVTNVIDKHRGILAELGERFLTYRCPEVSDEETKQRCWRVSSPGKVTEQEAELKQAATQVLTQSLHRVVLSDSFRDKVIQVAEYVAKARCEVMRDMYTKEPEIPTPEIATRLTRQLCDLATGIAIVRGKRHISKDIQRLIQRTALDSLTLKRITLLRELYYIFPRFATVAEIAQKIKFSESIVRRWLEDLLLLGLVERETKEGKVTSEHYWRTRYKSILKEIYGV